MDIEKLQNLHDTEKAKIFAAYHALQFVESGMNIGIGTGSTAAWFVRLLADKKANGLKFRACATSTATTKLAESLGIEIDLMNDFVALDDEFPLHLAIDGADEFDSDHNLIKGGGGALLHEKMVEQMAQRFIVITDASKEVERLGNFPLPIEVVRSGWGMTQVQLEWGFGDSKRHGGTRGGPIRRRMVGDKPFITDEGHYILDLHLQFINNLHLLDAFLKTYAGVVETGLFLGMATDVVMADSEGVVKSRETGGEWKETRYDWDETFAMLL